MKANAQITNLDTYTPRILALVLLAACVLLMLTGCQHQSAAPANLASASDVAGTYTLVSIDGKTVPCAIHHEGADMDIKSGSFTFTADGHCRTRTVIGVKGAAKDAVIVRQATYKSAGEEFIMRWQGMGTTKGTLVSNDFTMNNEGMVFDYRKQ